MKKLFEASGIFFIAGSPFFNESPSIFFSYGHFFFYAYLNGFAKKYKKELKAIKLCNIIFS